MYFITYQQTFQDPCTPVMEAIVEVHAYIMFFLISIVTFGLASRQSFKKTLSPPMYVVDSWWDTILFLLWKNLNSFFFDDGNSNSSNQNPNNSFPDDGQNSDPDEDPDSNRWKLIALSLLVIGFFVWAYYGFPFMDLGKAVETLVNSVVPNLQTAVNDITVEHIKLWCLEEASRSISDEKAAYYLYLFKNQILNESEYLVPQFQEIAVQIARYSTEFDQAQQTLNGMIYDVVFEQAKQFCRNSHGIQLPPGGFTPR